MGKIDFDKWIGTKSKKFRGRFVYGMCIIIFVQGIIMGLYIIPELLKALGNVMV